MPARSCPLPAEMISAIIDYLHGDKMSLDACSLVCKAWTHPARLHLFSRLVLTAKWPSQFAVFPFVRHLKLFHYRYCDEAPIAWDQVIPLLVGFHRIILLEIHLGWHSLDLISPRSWSTLSKNFGGIVSLSLTRFSGSELSLLARITCSFSRLQELALDGFVKSESPSTGIISATAFRLPPDLSTLELKGMELSAMLEWLLSLPDPPALRTVRLYRLLDQDLAIVHRFIRALGNDLEALSLSTDIEWTHHSIDVTPLTQLRSIEFVIYTSDHPSHWVAQTLLRISSARLEDVMFNLDFSDCDSVANTLEGSDVDAVLQHSAFSRLRKVHFRGLPSQAACASVVRHLPQCAARGILRVDER